MASKFNKMFGLVSIDPVQEVDCTLFVNKSNKEDLNTIVTVKPFNKMFSTVDIVDSLKITKGLTPLKDAFVREKYPTFNYGSTQDLMAGKNSTYNEVYRTFIDFDLKSISKNVIFTKAELVFYTRDRNYIVPDIELYTVDKHWDEYGVTWANQPNVKPSDEELEEILINNPDYVWTPPHLVAKHEDNLKGKTEIRFDLTHVIQKWRNGEILEHGLMLKLSNELIGQYKSFYSRESGIYTAPRLLVTYYDPNPPSLGRYDLDNSIYIKAIDDVDLQSELEVLPPLIKEVNKDIDCSINIRNNSYLDSELTIIKPVVDGWLKVETPSDINSKISVIGKDNFDTLSKLQVFKTIIDSEIDVRNNADVDSEITIHRNKDINNKITIKRNENNDINSELLAMYKVDLNSKISVSNTKNTEINTNLTIKRNENKDFNNVILATWIHDYNNILAVQNNIYSDFCDKLTVRNNLDKDINNELKVTPTKNLDSVLYTSQPDLNSQIEVSMPNDIETQLIIQRNENLDNNCIIEVHNIKELLGRIVVSKSDISGIIDITHQKSLDSEIVIRRNENFDYNNQISIQRYNENDINNKIFVFNYEDCNSQLSVQRYNDINLQTKLSVQRYDKIDVNSIIDVTNFKEILCRLAVSNAELKNIIDVHHHYDLDSNIIVQRNENFDIDNYLYVKNLYFDNELIVRRNENHDTNSRLSIDPTKEVISEIEVHNYKELDSKIIIKIPFAQDVKTICEVRNKAIIDNELIIRNNVDDDLDSNIIVQRNDFIDCDSELSIRRYNNGDLDNNLSVQRYGDLDIKSEIRLLKNEDINSSLFVVNYVDYDINSYIQTRPINRMYGMVDILEAPKLEYKANPIQDSYVRKTRPLFNYGTTNDMFVGQNGSDIYRSYLQFKKPKLPKNIYLLNAKIRLYVSIATQFIGAFELCNLNNSWIEQGITWQNAPNSLTSASIKYDGSTLQKYVEIDIKDYIDAWLNTNVLDNGFVIKSSNENISKYASFFTRESKFPPELIINYYDLSVTSQSKVDVDSKLVVMTPSIQDCDCEILIPSYDGDTDLDSSIEVSSRGYLDSSITVITTTIDSELTVKKNVDNDIDSIISISDESDIEINSNIYVYNDFINTELIVKKHSYEDISNIVDVYNHIDFNNVLTVRRNIEEDLISTIQINRENLDCILEVTKEQILNSELIVRNNINNDLDTELNIVHNNEINSYIKVLYPDMPRYLDSEMLIQRHENKDIHNSILVMYEKSLDSNIVIRNNIDNDLESKLSVVNYGFNEFNNLIEITREKSINCEINISPEICNCIIEVTNYKDLNSNIDIVSVGDIEGKFVVRRNENKELNSNIEIIPTSQINSEITIIPTEELNSTIITREVEHKDIDSNIEVEYGKSINNVILVKTPSKSEIDNLIKINPTCELLSNISVIPTKNIDCYMLVREVGQQDLDTKLEVDIGKSIDCEIIIRTPVNLDFDNLIEVFPTIDINSEIKILSTKDINCKILIREPSQEDINSVIEVGSIIGYVFIM